MIVVKIMGGLGNQMLQYAVGKQLAIIHNTELYLDLGWFNNNTDLQYPREFRLDQYCTQFKLTDLDKLSWKLRFTDHFKGLNPFKLKNIREDSSDGYDHHILKAGNNILLEGYFTSYKYFESIRNILIREFQPLPEMDSVNSNLLQKIQETNAVSVHIRRGDYALTGFHGMLQNSYYEAAIRYIEEEAGPLQLFVFSDEPEWVATQMKFNHPYELITHNMDTHNFWDLELMKHCKHHVIANSTFSWWGAWLNEHDEKLVVAPRRWFENEVVAHDMVPSGWQLF